MEKKTLISLVVPTKNRYKYLKYLIEYVEQLQDNYAIEMIIQDNTETNTEIVDYFKEKGTSETIRYFHESKPISLRVNADLAVNHAKGDFVLFLGDDDCFLPSLFEVVNYAIKNNFQAIVSPRLTYVWPDASTEINYLSTDNTLRIYTRKFKEINPQAELNECLKSGGQSMMNMPHLYHGVVAKSALEDVYKAYNTYFPGPSPDMANAVALALGNVKTLYVDYPLIIAGTGFVRVKGNTKGDRLTIHDAKFLPSNTEELWCNKIPKYWTTPTIYAQTVYQVVKQANPSLLDLFHWDRFYIAYGVEFISDFIFELNCTSKFKFIPRILIGKLKQYLYRYFKNEINKCRGYKLYEFNQESADKYALSVENQLGVLKYE